jgi:hypothetical protein
VQGSVKDIGGDSDGGGDLIYIAAINPAIKQIVLICLMGRPRNTGYDVRIVWYFAGSRWLRQRRHFPVPHY